MRPWVSVPDVNPFRRFGRLAWLAVRAPQLPPIDPQHVGRVQRRVMLGDIDELRHMNNGVYLSMLDHARQELVVRTGVWARLRAAKMYPVVTAQTITYRKSLTYRQRYDIESRLLGLDDRCVYMEQRFVVEGEIYARAFVQARFLRDAGGTVPTDELAEVTGIDPEHFQVPEWLHEWAAHVRLPGTRQPAPSGWGDSETA